MKQQDQLQVGCVIKHSSLHGSLLIKPVSKQTAKQMIITNHYSHKWNGGGFGKYNYGIFRTDDENICLGVAVFGYMKSPKARIFTHSNPQAWMCELNRLWISDELGMNAETILMAAAIKLLRRADTNIVAIQSFADGRLGCGTIYKAANFRYYGYHISKFLQNRRSGEVVHQQILTNSMQKSAYIRSNIAYLLGDYDVFTVKTYRYIYHLSDKVVFKFKQEPYPPYEKGFETIVWQRDEAKIRENLIQLLVAMGN